jgi:dTDP-4-amino-4,6-dideoxygalactose transaminase
VIQTVDRTGLQQALLADGIGAQIHYPTPIHLQPACACYGYRRGMLPVTEQLATKIISLPMYPELTEQQIQLVINSVKKHVTERALRSCE